MPFSFESALRKSRIALTLYRNTHPMGISAEDCCFETHYARREDNDNTTPGRIKPYYFFSRRSGVTGHAVAFTGIVLHCRPGHRRRV